MNTNVLLVNIETGTVLAKGLTKDRPWVKVEGATISPVLSGDGSSSIHVSLPPTK